MLLTMNDNRWKVSLVLCLVCVSANEEHPNDGQEQLKDDFCEQDHCETHILRAPLGSTALLPCIFTIKHPSLVSWIQTPGMHVVNFTSDEYIQFTEPRNGRVSVFPNEHSRGNYSISIDELKHSDLGCYRCEKGHDCVQVELGVRKDTQSELMSFVLYICSAIAAFIVLCVGVYCCMKYRVCCNKTIKCNVDHPAGGADTGVPPGDIVPVEERSQAPAERQQEGANIDDPVYENEDHDPSNEPDYLNTDYHNLAAHRSSPSPRVSMAEPSPSQFNVMRGQSRKTKHRFHTELLNRLQQASINRHHYANQDEICLQQATASQENNDKGSEYRNPIYNRSTDRL